MSQENVELYRQGIDAFNRRDLDAFLALADPGVVGISRVLQIEGASYEGHEGTREWWNSLLGVFPDFTIEVLSVRDAGDRTVAELRNRAQGEGGPASLEELVWQVSEWRDGLVVRWQMFDTERDAFEAAGLSD
jgi:SnoaL-like protein